MMDGIKIINIWIMVLEVKRKENRIKYLKKG